MLLTANSSKEFEKTPEGTHIARCFLIADLGTQEGSYEGKPTFNRKIIFCWETPTKLMEDGRPFSVSKEFTASIGDKAKLKTVLESWKGSPFTPEEKYGFSPAYFLSRPCFINVQHKTSMKGKTYADITSVMQMPEGISAPSIVNAPVYFSLDEYDQASFELLPEWIQKKVKESPEYQAISNAPDMSDAPPMEDDFPADGEGVPF